MGYSDEQKRSHIEELQTYLHRISYEDPKIPRITPDGIYGPETADAVRAFQQAYGLTDSGEANSATWEKAAEVYRTLIGTLAETLEVFPPRSRVMVQSGDAGLAVLIIQSILRVLGEAYADLPRPEVTGLYDAPTAEAVKAFQQRSHYPVTGDVDLLTWNLLASSGAEHRLPR
ncbi:MAG: peptidoglycan-binding protein [Oscillospiraceae bacterium]|nr:peptidoglycan-binding protein [Oscillospiraceae bacterium]